MCVIEYVDHHSAFTTTNTIIPRIISSSSSAHAPRAHAPRACTGAELDDSNIHVSDKTDDNTRDVSNRTGHLKSLITSSVIEIQQCPHDNNMYVSASVSVSEWIQVNMIDIATSFGATDATFWKTNF